MKIVAICTAVAAMAFGASAAYAQTASQPQPATPPAPPPAQSAGLQVTTSVDSDGVTVHRVTNGPVADTPENRQVPAALGYRAQHQTPRQIEQGFPP